MRTRAFGHHGLAGVLGLRAPQLLALYHQLVLATGRLPGLVAEDVRGHEVHQVDADAVQRGGQEGVQRSGRLVETRRRAGEGSVQVDADEGEHRGDHGDPHPPGHGPVTPPGPEAVQRQEQRDRRYEVVADRPDLPSDEDRADDQGHGGGEPPAHEQRRRQRHTPGQLLAQRRRGALDERTHAVDQDRDHGTAGHHDRGEHDIAAFA
jgi:hypothetical protein